MTPTPLPGYELTSELPRPGSDDQVFAYGWGWKAAKHFVDASVYRYVARKKEPVVEKFEVKIIRGVYSDLIQLPEGGKFQPGDRVHVEVRLVERA